jgi:hypothetical protein
MSLPSRSRRRALLITGNAPSSPCLKKNGRLRNVIYFVDRVDRPAFAFPVTSGLYHNKNKRDFRNTINEMHSITLVDQPPLEIED